jgi:vacuolar-type H+-ATPase subunit F/Vma7
MIYKTAIVGPKEEVLVFSALGVRSFFANTPDKAREILFELKKNMSEDVSNNAEKFAIIFVMEELLAGIAPEDYEKISSGALPSVISLPGNRGTTGYGNEKIRRIVEKAVGSDIFGNE